MIRRGPLLAAAAFLTLLAGGCGDPDPQDGRSEAGAEAQLESGGGDRVRVVDHQGREVRLPAPPERVISLVPSATAILRELGAGDRLVARTDYDTAAALAHLPSVGGGLEPSMERLVSLDPEVVVRFRAESDPATPERLDRAGVPHVAVRPDGLDDVGEMVAMMGELAGEPQEARRLWNHIQEELEAVAGDAPEERPRVVFLLGGNPPLAAGPRTFLGELLEVAGAVNAFRDLDELYPPVSLEELSAREVDRVLAPEDADVPDLPPSLEVTRVPGWVQQPGPWMARAAGELAQAIHRQEEAR